MSRSIGFLMVVIVAAVGGYLYTKQAKSVIEIGSTPQTTVEVTAVRNDLLGLANAERRYWVSNGKYATLDELRTGGDISLPVRANYSYSAQATETGFKIVAAYSGPDPKAPRRMVVDETMAIATE